MKDTLHPENEKQKLYREDRAFVPFLQIPTQTTAIRDDETNEKRSPFPNSSP